MSTYQKVALAAEQNPELAQRVEIACEIKGIPFTHDLYIKLINRVANKLVEVSEVVRISAEDVSDANIDTALSQLVPDEPDPSGEVE